MNTITKAEFIGKYADNLKAKFAWAQDVAKLDNFIQSVNRTLYNDTNDWNIDGEVVRQTWKECGFTGKPTYKALRALPLP